MSFFSLARRPLSKDSTKRSGGRGVRSHTRLNHESLEQRLAMAALVPYDQTFNLNSLPGATKTIFLDFTGHRTQGTAWNILESDPEIVCTAFSIDGSSAFSFEEQEFIQQAWAYVAEDFRPFNVNVTTREPSLADIVASGSGDARWGTRCVISDGSNDENPVPPMAAGVAFLGSFKSSVDVPSFVDTSKFSLTPENVALVATHEIGHTLGLDHHGIGSNSGVPNPIDGKFDYYEGHTNGKLSWGPIMGAPYGQQMTQWSKGEYASASRPFQDDLAILSDLSGVGGFTYRADDRAESFASATALARPLGKTTLQSKGIIERNTDADMYRFTVKTGQVNLQIRPFDAISSTTFSGANLDIGATLYSADGRVVANLQPADRIDARFVGNLVGGTYYVKVFGSGNAEPLATGYSNYGSLGQYTVEVSETPATQSLVSVAGPASVVEGTGRVTVVPFTVTLSAPATQSVTVTYATRDRTATTADGDYAAASGTLTFAAGETKKTVNVSVAGDSTSEATESFVFEISNPVNAALGKGEAVVEIVNDDRVVPPPLPVVSVSGPGSAIQEGQAAVFTIALSTPAAKSITISYKTISGTAVAGKDFTYQAAKVTFLAGESVKTISVATIDDTLGENAESFFLDISATASAAKIGTGRGTATIALSDGGAKLRSAMRAAMASLAITEAGSSISTQKLVQRHKLG